ncbi:MAG: hypothetical protein HOE90_03695 [Bacteriovoracaceae bacterium]|nr:hypothetical protein [Bacteriovoracaceae bacterium]
MKIFILFFVIPSLSYSSIFTVNLNYRGKTDAQLNEFHSDFTYHVLGCVNGGSY